MNKLLMGLVAAFMGLTLLSAVADGGGGLQSTHLTANAAIGDVAFTVDDTTGFLTTGVLYVGSERVSYTGKNATHFTGLTRGFETTTAKAHANGSEVFSEDMGVINQALGFDVGTLAAANGFTAIFSIPWHFMTNTMPRLILWNYSFLQDGGYLEMLRWILVGISSIVYLAFVINLGTMIASVLKR